MDGIMGKISANPRVSKSYPSLKGDCAEDSSKVDYTLEAEILLWLVYCGRRLDHAFYHLRDRACHIFQADAR
jgi:hypothetical protein